MLKSEVKNLSEKKELPFPKLMRTIYNDNVIILAHKKVLKEGRGEDLIEGIVVSSKEGSKQIGYYCQSFGSSILTDFYGSVTLTQTPE